jgi:branched-chain amino acid aminotransferase
MALKIWLDDKLVDREQAAVSVFDHGLLYGDGVFEGIRTYNGKIFEFKAHLDRLYESAKVIRLAMPMDYDQMASAVEQTVAANDANNGYIRLIVTRGVGTLGLNPFTCEKGCVIIIASEIHLYPEELYETGLKVISSTTISKHPLTIPPQVKSLNYLNNIMAKIEALDAGVLEAIMYNEQGYVAEASGDNVFIIKDDVVYTPPAQAGALKGITADVVMRIARQMGLEVRQQDLTRFDLYTADEFFLTGTAAEVIGIVEIDKRVVGEGKPGAITKQLREKFYEYARNQ